MALYSSEFVALISALALLAHLTLHAMLLPLSLRVPPCPGRTYPQLRQQPYPPRCQDMQFRIPPCRSYEQPCLLLQGVPSALSQLRFSNCSRRAWWYFTNPRIQWSLGSSPRFLATLFLNGPFIASGFWLCALASALDRPEPLGLCLLPPRDRFVCSRIPAANFPWELGFFLGTQFIVPDNRL